MALIKCPECGREVSDRAKACPNCGYPIAEIESGAQEILTNEESQPDVVIPNETDAPQEMITNGKNEWCVVIPFTVSFLKCGYVTTELLEKGHITTDEKIRFVQNKEYPFLLKSGLSKADADIIGDIVLNHQIAVKICRFSEWEQNECIDGIYPNAAPATAPGLTLQASSRAAGTAADGKALASPEEMAAAKRSAKRVGILWAVVLGLFALLVIIKAVDSGPSTYKYSSSGSSSYSSGYKSSSSTASSSSSSKYSNDDYETALYLAAKKAVSNYLKAPSTAKFGKQSDCVFEIGDGGTYLMAGVVDSENSFGASLRETWAVMATVEDNKMVVFVVTIGDNTYFP